MPNWEVQVSALLGTLRAERIRRRFVAFAVLATLIPSVSTAWLSYVQNRRALTQKIAEALRGASSQGAREVDLWMKERLYDVRVFASSYEVSENLDRIRRGIQGPAVSRLTDYLSSVKERFTDYHQLVVVNASGVLVATSTAGAGAVVLPPDWSGQARTRDAIVGAVYWDSAAGRPLMALGVPITTNDGRFLGAMVAQLDLSAIVTSLKTFAEERSNALYLIAGRGALVLSSNGASQQLMRDSLGPKALDLLTQEGRLSTEYTNHAGVDVLGSLAPIHRLDWAVVAELPADVAYAQVVRLRNLALLTVSVLLLVIGGLAYLLGLTIVLPLDRMAQGARQVAEGNLSVALPVVRGGGEVSYVTEVFNDMVTRLRHGREELERLSRTDGLTGLPNRRNLMETLEKEVRRAKRNERPFSLLMVDVDHFKRYNDTFGHLAGDEVLKRLAQVLSAAIRTADYAARYGGEEFTVVLPETRMEGALEVAERIRAKMEEQRFGDDGAGRVTLSIGMAEYPTDGGGVEAVTSAADGALYAAKEHGRNRVVTTRTELMPTQVEGTPLDLDPEPAHERPEPRNAAPAPVAHPSAPPPPPPPSPAEPPVAGAKSGHSKKKKRKS